MLCLNYNIGMFPTKSNLLQFQLEDSDDIDMDDGGESGGGSTAPLIDPALFGLENYDLTEKIRKGERKFGESVPITKDRTKKRSYEEAFGESLTTHPLFRDSSQFSGMDENDNPSPSSNPDAIEEARNRLENRLQNQLSNRKKNRLTATPSLKR